MPINIMEIYNEFSKAMAWCKTIVNPSQRWRLYNSFATLNQNDYLTHDYQLSISIVETGVFQFLARNNNKMEAMKGMEKI